MVWNGVFWWHWRRHCTYIGTVLTTKVERESYNYIDNCLYDYSKRHGFYFCQQWFHINVHIEHNSVPPALNEALNSMNPAINENSEWEYTVCITHSLIPVQSLTFFRMALSLSYDRSANVELSMHEVRIGSIETPTWYNNVRARFDYILNDIKWRKCCI